MKNVSLSGIVLAVLLYGCAQQLDVPSAQKVTETPKGSAVASAMPLLLPSGVQAGAVGVKPEIDSGLVRGAVDGKNIPVATQVNGTSGLPLAPTLHEEDAARKNNGFAFSLPKADIYYKGSYMNQGICVGVSPLVSSDQMTRDYVAQSMKALQDKGFDAVSEIHAAKELPFVNIDFNRMYSYESPGYMFTPGGYSIGYLSGAKQSLVSQIASGDIFRELLLHVATTATWDNSSESRVLTLRKGFESALLTIKPYNGHELTVNGETIKSLTTFQLGGDKPNLTIGKDFSGYEILLKELGQDKKPYPASDPAAVDDATGNSVFGARIEGRDVLLDVDVRGWGDAARSVFFKSLKNAGYERTVAGSAAAYYIDAALWVNSGGSSTMDMRLIVKKNPKDNQFYTIHAAAITYDNLPSVLEDKLREIADAIHNDGLVGAHSTIQSVIGDDTIAQYTFVNRDQKEHAVDVALSAYSWGENINKHLFSIDILPGNWSFTSFGGNGGGPDYRSRESGNMSFVMAPESKKTISVVVKRMDVNAAPVTMSIKNMRVDGRAFPYGLRAPALTVQ